MKKCVLILGALIIPQTFYSQEKESKIDSVNIFRRSKIEIERTEFQRHAQSTETLSESELNRNNSSFIEQSLGTLAGVQVDKRTQLGGQRIVIRGYGNDQKFNNWGIKSYLNSVPITNADGVTILEDIDFSLINQVEVIKGPAATMYGGGVGGVVRFYMKPSTEKGVTLSQKFIGGSFNLMQTATRVDAVTDNSSLMFNYGHIQSDGYRPRGNSLKNTYSFLGNFKINAKQELTVYANHTNSDEGVTGQISFDDYYAGNDPGNLAYANRNAANNFDVSRATVSHKWSITPTITNFTSIFYSHLDAKRVAAGAAENSQNPNYGFRSVFMINNKLSEDFSNTIETGAEYSFSRSLISNYRFAGKGLETQPIGKGSYFKYKNNQLSFFLVERLTYKPLEMSLILGISGNKLAYNREDLLAYPGLVAGYNNMNLSFDKNFSTVFKPHIALQKTFGKQIINLSYSEGYNAPTAATAFINGINKPNDDLKPENARMWDFSVQGLLFNTKFDYQISVFNIGVTDKLTQVSGKDPVTGAAYTYWANTGNQKNKGIETSLGYKFENVERLIKRIEPFFNASYYDFRYQDFVTRLNNNEKNYIHNQVVGVPRTKFSLGVDLDIKMGLYFINTLNYVSDVYTDFGNTNKVKGFHQYNAKLGYKHRFGKWDFDGYIAGNNLTSQINYTFLFLGNSVNDSDSDSNYPAGVATDVSPGPSKAYFFGGFNLTYHF
ncbi:TonB-dependent receptor [Chryseobacterium sp. KCF3-3]|uniref:TonB-dependent receptor n=1 Tax=Chryseobacterium sp. KCF3-3 TaxID=3231511 RepID=UPI0038B4043C